MKVIYCAGEQGRVVLDILEAAGTDEKLIFADDNPSRCNEQIAGVEVVGGMETLGQYSPEAMSCLVAFGDRPGVRLQIVEALENSGHTFFNAVHPSATVSDSAALGTGLTINAQSYIGPDVGIGDHVLIDSCVNISHETTVEVGATVTPNATVAGGVCIEQDAYIGPNATITKDRTVGTGAIVGAGAVVTEDVPPHTTVVGVPAEPIER